MEPWWKKYGLSGLETPPEAIEYVIDFEIKRYRADLEAMMERIKKLEEKYESTRPA